VVIKAEKKNEKYYNRKIKLATKNVHAEKRGEKMQKKKCKKIYNNRRKCHTSRKRNFCV